MTYTIKGALVPKKLTPGECVAFVSPASTPPRKWVEDGVELLESMGLKVKIGTHVFDEYGYLAGKDENRLADINDALRDPKIKAILATCGGKGAYRIADGLDFTAARKNPKLFIGFSENTIIHLSLFKQCGLAGLHGAAWNTEFGSKSAESFKRAILTTEPIIIQSNKSEPTAALTTGGKATGILLGGNQDMIATAAGWALPSFKGAILLLEAIGMKLGHIDRQLTMLQNAGHLTGIKAIAVGQYTDCTSGSTTQGSWTAIDVLRDRLGKWGVPILGGLPIGHGKNPIAVPIGTRATLDADAKTLTVESAVS
ncbi:MAG TPA: LD-carboxypeptidase [Candidatus Saccharimonadales bacterium]|nr:LD-carboxypeptidase [Candidatus Saccharimonadales bacterium]